MQSLASLWITEPMRRLRECFGLWIVAPPCIEPELRWLDEQRFTRDGALAAHQPARDRHFTIRSHAQLAGSLGVVGACSARAGEGLAGQLNTLKGEHEGGGEWSVHSSESERSEGGAEEHIFAARRDAAAGYATSGAALDPVVLKRVETAQAAADEVKRSPLPDVEIMAHHLASEAGAEQGALLSGNVNMLNLRLSANAWERVLLLCYEERGLFAEPFTSVATLREAVLSIHLLHPDQLGISAADWAVGEAFARPPSNSPRPAGKVLRKRLLWR
ncbi:MAG: hypothetical protein SGPRY_003526 [Prymnesium sp.]